MKKILFTLALLVSINLFSQGNISKWNSKMYEFYDAKDFMKLEIVNSKVDFSNVQYELLTASIFYATNLERLKFNKTPLIYSRALNKAAQEHSTDMVKYNFYSHNSVVSGKSSMSDRLKLVGIVYASKAENIHNTYAKEIEPTYWSFALSVVQEWMDSSGHRKNILNSTYKYLGCGAYYYTNEEWIDYKWIKTTQNFSSADAKP